MLTHEHDINPHSSLTAKARELAAKCLRPAMAVAATAVAAVSATAALPAEYYADHSVLASGRWAKVKVTQTGIQRITYDELRAMGFADPSKVAVYGYGAPRLADYNLDADHPDDLPAVVMQDTGDAIIFYGAGRSQIVALYANTTGCANVIRALDSTCSYYYLTDTQPRAEMEYVDAEVVETTVPQVYGWGLNFMEINERRIGYGRIGAYHFGPNLVETGPQTYSIDMINYDNTLGNKQVVVSFGTASLSKQLGDIKIDFPGRTLTSSAAGAYWDYASHKDYFYRSGRTAATGILPNADGSDEYKFTLRIDDAWWSRDVREAALDYLSVGYPRLTTIRSRKPQEMVLRNVYKGQPIPLGEGVKGMKVWDITWGRPNREFVCKEYAYTPYEVKYDGTISYKDPVQGYGIIADRDYPLARNENFSECTQTFQYIVFDPNEGHKVEYVGDVANSDWHAMPTPEMLIVASDLTYDQALRLKELHARYTGVECAVVRFNDIKDEMASGLSHPMAVRRMVKMLYDRDPEKLKAVLLFARANKDNTGITATESPEQFAERFIPMLQCMDIKYCGEDPVSYSSDCIYGMLSENTIVSKGTGLYGAPYDIMVGRIPAQDATEARVYVDKVEQYLTNPPTRPLRARAIVTGDYGDNNTHIDQAATIRNYIGTLSPATMVEMVLIPTKNVWTTGNAELADRLRTVLQRGVGYWAYMGHSTGSTIIGGNNLWDIGTDETMHNDYPPFTVFATCQTQIFDSPERSLQLGMIFNPDGGMIAGVGPTRPVYAERNLDLSKIMCYGYYSVKGGEPMGAIFRNGRNLLALHPEEVDPIYPGKTSIYTSSLVNTMSYNFAGDPMMPVYAPTEKVAVTEINGLVPGEEVTLQPLDVQTLTGVINDEEGNVDETFNGTVTISVYDGNYTVDTKPSITNSAEVVYSVNIDSNLLCEVRMPVKQGRFSGDIRLPLPLREADGNRVTLYAISDDLHTHADGVLTGVRIPVNVEAFDQVADAALPEITEMYAVSPSQPEGGVVPPTFYVYATITPGDLQLMGSSDRIGGGLTLTADKGRRLVGVDSYLTIAPDGTGTLAYPVKDLADGFHELTLSVANVTGETVQRTIGVTVMNVFEGQTTADNRLARTDITFDVNHPLPTAAEGRLVVTDATGKIVYTAAGVAFPYVYDLVDNDGNALPDGHYRAAAYYSAEGRYGYAAPVSFAVGR